MKYQQPENKKNTHNVPGIPNLPLDFAGDFFSFAARFEILIIRHLSEALHHAAIHLQNLSFCLIVRTIIHNYLIMNLRRALARTMRHAPERAEQVFLSAVETAD